MTNLTGPERAAASGPADSIVVFLHGYGADGNDLIGLAEPLAPYLPHTRFLAPNAPDRCPGNPAGFQWFPIPWLDGTPEAIARVAAERAFGLLDRWLDDLEAQGIGPERTVLVGFSQGTMMALHVAPRRERQLAGVVGYSGMMADPVVPFASLAEAADVLAAAGVETYTHVSPGVGHGIAPDGLGLALSFIRQRLGSEDGA